MLEKNLDLALKVLNEKVLEPVKSLVVGKAKQAIANYVLKGEVDTEGRSRQNTGASKSGGGQQRTLKVPKDIEEEKVLYSKPRSELLLSHVDSGNEK